MTLKTLWENEKCWFPALSTFPILLPSLLTINYNIQPPFVSVFFSHKASLYFNPFPNKLWLLCVCSTNLLKTLWEKEKLLVTSNFLFSHSVFYPYGELSTTFIKFQIVICKLFQLGKVSNLSFGKGLMTLKGNDLENFVAKVEC